jgi:hypothetical protein
LACLDNSSSSFLFLADESTITSIAALTAKTTVATFKSPVPAALAVSDRLNNDLSAFSVLPLKSSSLFSVALNFASSFCV